MNNNIEIIINKYIEILYLNSKINLNVIKSKNQKYNNLKIYPFHSMTKNNAYFFNITNSTENLITFFIFN